jgi:basic membrane protein A
VEASPRLLRPALLPEQPIDAYGQTMDCGGKTCARTRVRAYLRTGTSLAVVLACVVFAAGAGASISGSSGHVALIAPPPSVLFGAADVRSDTTAFAFDEQQCVPLASDLRVDISTPGTYHLSSGLTAKTLPTGTLVSSHFIDAERRTFAGEKSREYTGSIRLDAQVIGIEVRAGGLDRSDFLGASGTRYPTGMPFRRENLDGKQLDTVTLSPDSHTVSFDLQVTYFMDQIRVITACGDGPPPPSKATIAVRVVTQPAGDPTTFSFGGDVSGSVGDGGSLGAQEPAGEYTTTETVPHGWTLTSVSCDSGGSGNIVNDTATFAITAGQLGTSLTCTFTDTKNADVGGGGPGAGGGTPGGGGGGGGDQGGNGNGPTPPAPTLEVALLTATGAQTDLGLGRLAARAFSRVQQSQGVTVSVENAKTPAEYASMLSSLADSGHGLVIAAGPALYAAVRSVAARFPQTDFVILGHAWSNGDPANLQGVVFRQQEAGYLAGYLGGLVAGPSASYLSSIGGRDVGMIDSFLAGYRAGVVAAAPHAHVLTAFSRDLSTEKACRSMALDQIARGSKVVFEVAGNCGLGAFAAASQKRVWAIGVNGDRVGTGVLASALERSDIAVINALRQFQAGAFKGGSTVVYTVKNGGVGIGNINAKVSKADLARLALVKKQIATGKLTPPASLELGRHG